MENENQEVFDEVTELDAEVKIENQENIEENDQKTAENQQNLQDFKPKMKFKFNFKLFLSILFVTIMVGVIATISTFSCIEKSYDFGFNTPAYIKLHTTDKTSTSNNQIFDSGTEEYDKIIELYNQSLKTTLLDAALQGKAKNVVRAQEGFASISSSSLEGTYIEFYYNEVQEVYLNGEKYEANIVGDESYYVIVIEVLNSSSLSEVNAYFKYRSNNSSEYSYVRLTTFAAQAELYNYIENSL